MRANLVDRFRYSDPGTNIPRPRDLIDYNRSRASRHYGTRLYQPRQSTKAKVTSILFSPLEVEALVLEPGQAFQGVEFGLPLSIRCRLRVVRWMRTSGNL